MMIKIININRREDSIISHEKILHIIEKKIIIKTLPFYMNNRAKEA